MATIAVAGLYMLSFTGKRPDQLGIRNGSLAPLPDSPNCVSSYASDESKRMDPIPLQGDAGSMIHRIVETVRRLPRTRIVTQTEDYLHVEFTSPIFRFVDDVEFLVDDKDKVVQFRSASRVGHSDLGANRRRMQKIIELLKQ